jgi:hypothetical protein
MVFIGVGATTIIPQEIGKLTRVNELMRIGHGMNSPVSGWIAVLKTV